MNILKSVLDWIIRLGASLGNILSWCRSAAALILSNIAKMFFPAMTATIAILWGVLKAIVGWFQKIYASLVTAQNQLADASSGISGVTASGPSGLDFLNYGLPVQELFDALVLLVAVFGACYLYRFIKSWIPSVSS